MTVIKHKVFISFHHDNDQKYKDELVKMGNAVFIDMSVKLGEIPEEWSDERIRTFIRDEHLRDSTVTILLVGKETKFRKHVDWELYSSMFDGKVNKKSGIVVVLLPTAKSEYYTVGHANEKKLIYPEQTQWLRIISRQEFEKRYPYMPERIIDNLLKQDALISVINWDKLNEQVLKLLIENAYLDRDKCNYDLSRQLRRKNSSSTI